MAGVDRIKIAGQCGTLRCEPAWSWHPQAGHLREFDLWFVWAGSGEMRTAEGAVALTPGTLFCLRPGEEYHATHDPTRRLGVSYLHFEFVNSRGRSAAPVTLPPLFCRVSEIDWTERLLRQAVHLRHSDDAARTEQACRLVEAVLISMRGEKASAAVSSGERVQREAVATVARFVRENPGTFFSVPQLAARAGYSVDHFTRLFTRHQGRTPKEFCIAVRTERACQLLRESAMSVEQVAENLGYGDVYFFSRQFKLRTGRSPTDWRKVPGAGDGRSFNSQSL